MSANAPQVNQEKYHTAKWWQIALFSANNSSTNIYLFAFGFVVYYATGLVGLAMLFISQLMGYIRIFDGVIDPAIGVLIDKTETRFGKYRPIIVLGNLITVASFLILFTTHTMPQPLHLPILIAALIIHKIGYSLQASVTKAAQSVLTSDPKQRPLFNIADGLLTVFIFTGGQIFASNYLEPKHGGFTAGFFQELVLVTIIVSAILGIMAIIGIAGKDRKEYFGLGENTKETKISDYKDVIKGNRPLQILSLAAAFIKFCAQLIGDQVVMIILFGIILGNFGLSGQMSMLTIIPNLLIMFAATALARKTGLRKAYVTYAVIAAASFAAMGFLIPIMQPGDVNFGDLTLKAVLFIVVYVMARGFTQPLPSLVLTMSADISDYETSRSGRYVAGLIGTIFSLTDSVASSFAPMAIGWVLAAIGFGNAYPTTDTPLTGDIRMAAIIFFAVLPAASILLALGLMKFYKLDSKAMEKVQERIAELKAQGKLPEEGDAADVPVATVAPVVAETEVAKNSGK